MKRFRAGRSDGFTLIEVLIASMLFSLIVFLAVYSFNQSFLHYGMLSKQGLDFSKYARILWLYQITGAVLDYYVYDEERKLWFPLFVGDTDQIVYVTGSPLSSSLPSLVILRREPEGTGTYRLIYVELPVYTLGWKEVKSLLAKGDLRATGKLLTLFEGLERLQFSYYGYDLGRNDYFWTGTFYGNKNLCLPAIVRIEYSRNGISEEIVLPVRSNTRWKTFYNEFFKDV